MDYNPDNIFAKILKGAIPCQKVFEDDYVLAFHDINPKAPVHVLVIPKGAYISSADFHHRGSDQEISGYYRGLQKVIDQLQIAEKGFRLLSNCGAQSGQEVFHFHTHIFSGKALGPMLCPHQ